MWGSCVASFLVCILYLWFDGLYFVIRFWVYWMDLFAGDFAAMLLCAYVCVLIVLLDGCLLVIVGCLMWFCLAMFPLFYLG